MRVRGCVWVGGLKARWRQAGGVGRETLGVRGGGGGEKQAECASHLIEPRSANLPRHLRLGGRCCAVPGKRPAEDALMRADILSSRV